MLLMSSQHPRSTRRWHSVITKLIATPTAEVVWSLELTGSKDDWVWFVILKETGVTSQEL